ncbi:MULTISPECIES: hypothetical protein [unclassified Methanopyrus]|nr:MULTISPECIES: hypothetical protein [unclassified Methanopyrus]
MSNVHSDLRFVFQGGGGYAPSEKIVTAQALERARREYGGQPIPL